MCAISNARAVKNSDSIYQNLKLFDSKLLGDIYVQLVRYKYKVYFLQEKVNFLN